MPFLSYFEGITTIDSQREIRGNEEGIWQDLQTIDAIGHKVRVREGKVSRRIITSGDCEGLWRVYYSAISSDTVDRSGHEAPTFMSFELPRNCTKIMLGTQFESWIKNASQIYNRFLKTRDLKDLDAIENPHVRDYFRCRAQEHMAIAGSSEEFDTCEMECPAVLGPFPDLPLADLNPDGMFLKGNIGAVFESKIARPTYDRLRCELTAYALLAERWLAKNHKDIPIDFAVILHANYPDERLEVQKIPITDSYARDVLKNVYKFGKLLQFSLAEKDIEFADVGGRSAPLQKVTSHLDLLRRGSRIRPFKSWKELLERPPGVPSTYGRRPCARCEHSNRCLNGGS